MSGASTRGVSAAVHGCQPRLLIVVNVDWFFLSHRLPVAIGAVQAGYEVHVATTLTGDASALERHGLIVHALHIDRSSSGLLGLFGLLASFLRLFWRLRPDVAHLVTIKPVLLGGLAVRLSPVRGVVYAVSGLGHVFVAAGMFGRLRRALAGAWYRAVLGARNMRIIFQNPEDRAAIESVAKLSPSEVVMIPGSGVDLAEYEALPLPDGVPVVMMASRLLATKGVREFIDAARMLRRQGVQARFWLAGEPDDANPASIARGELEAWKKEGVVELLGHRADMPALMRQAHVVVLPSYYGEGLPKVLIEAAACGRAVVTTDMPGCRDAVEAEVTGVLVPPKNASALAHAVERLVQDATRCARMGLAGRARAERLFDVGAVVAAHLAVYRELEEAAA